MSVFLRHAREIAYEHKTPARTPEHSPSQRVGCCCWEYCFLLMALHYHASSEYEEMSLAWLVEREGRKMSSAIMVQIRMGGGSN